MTEEEQNYVELQDEDGTITKCEVVDIVEFEEKTYALLLPIGEDETYDDEEVIVIEYVEAGKDGEDSYFQNIEDEDEFNRVCEYIQSLNEEDNEEAE